MITFDSYESKFGNIVVGFNEERICWLSFSDIEPFIQEFPEAVRKNVPNLMKRIFEDKEEFPLYLFGTDFQLKVWWKLKEIKEPTSYKKLAELIGHPTAIRAVATAVGKNRISYLIPCHFIIPSNGGIGKYRWGSEIKSKILFS